MNYAKKIIAPIVSALLFAGLFSGCGPESQPAAAEKKAPLKVATNATYVPFEFKGDTDADYQGFEIDIIRGVAKILGRDIEFRNIPFSGLIPALSTNEVDLAASGMTVTGERMNKLLFSSPFYESQLVVMTKKNRTNINSPQDLTGHTVAVQVATIAASYAETINGAQLKQFDSNAESLMDLKIGGVDAVITDRPVADYFAAKQSEENIKVIPATDAPKQYFSFATNKKSTQLMNDIDKAIAQMKETGEFARIYKKWFAQEPPQMPITPEEAVQLSK